MNKLVIISGAGGMDAVYLSKYLLDLGYTVVGIIRRSAGDNEWRLKTIRDHKNYKLVYGDITDQGSISKIVSTYRPDEFFHLAANSFVGCSWDSPYHVLETNALGTINCLEAIRHNKKDCKFYFAGSSEMYGDYVRRKGGDVILDEDSPMIAASPYGVSKVAGYQMTKVYRESHGIFASCGILFNHCGPLRSEEFFTRKITSQLAKIYHDKQEKIKVGNLSASRDEGFSGEYVKAMHLMLQHQEPDDFVIATGETHSCNEWLDLSLKWFSLGRSCIEVDQKLFRPNEVNVLIGNADKAYDLLRWKHSMSFKDLNNKMCQYDAYAQSINEVHKADSLIF